MVWVPGDMCHHVSEATETLGSFWNRTYLSCWIYVHTWKHKPKKITLQTKTVKDVLDPKDNLGAVGLAFVLVPKRHLPMQTSTLGSSGTSILSARWLGPFLTLPQFPHLQNRDDSTNNLIRSSRWLLLMSGIESILVYVCTYSQNVNDSGV